MLTEVLKRARIEDLTKCRLIDLGIGCGEQSLVLAAKCRQYIGITIDAAQFRFAEGRLAEQRSSSAVAADQETDKILIRLWQADAARPASWESDLREATTCVEEEDPGSPSWILALDCLYHFSPSREPFFRYAYHQSKASLMIFDLVISPSATLAQRLALRAIAFVLDVPPRNFMPITKYRNQLVKAGYDGDNIEFDDISSRVFEGLADYIERRDQEWRMYTGQGMGRYRHFARILRWWHNTSLVRGVVVIARR